MEPTHVTVRFWAGARAAAGVDQLEVPVTGDLSLTALTDRVLTQLSGDSLERVIASCSVLVDGVQAGTTAPEEFLVRAGQTVEMLPPFAGG